MVSMGSVLLARGIDDKGPLRRAEGPGVELRRGSVGIRGCGRGHYAVQG